MNTINAFTNNQTFGASYRIEAKDNKHINYLYNSISGITKRKQIPSEFHSDYVVITTSTKTQDLGLSGKLNHENIAYTKDGVIYNKPAEKPTMIQRICNLFKFGK